MLLCHHNACGRCSLSIAPSCYYAELACEQCGTVTATGTACNADPRCKLFEVLMREDVALRDLKKEKRWKIMQPEKEKPEVKKGLPKPVFPPGMADDPPAESAQPPRRRRNAGIQWRQAAEKTKETVQKGRDQCKTVLVEKLYTVDSDSIVTLGNPEQMSENPKRLEELTEVEVAQHLNLM